MKRRISLLLLGLMFIASACSSQTNGGADSFKDQAAEEFETDVYIPEYEKYPITSAEIKYPPTGDKKDLVVVYSKEKGKLRDKEFIEKYESTMDSKVLYGLYDGEPWLFIITYSNFEIIDGDNDSKIKTINGVDVHYREISADTDMLVTFFNLEEGSYHIEFSLREGMTREKAFEVVEDVIENNG
ncbi:hypothetical protein ACQCVH_08070 [Bacillus infantis]|uniref:hypothetical protein n=1 Tax=Bacillus infantis TaxID=324767 RepID=UPI003CE94DCF